MAETDLYTAINNPQLPPNPNKFYTHFFYKAVFVSIFLLLLPLFPSESTGSWELLQLLFAGIAISYGLFSKRNDETQKEQPQGSIKSDNTQSYVAGLLQVSSVFDDDSENASGSDPKIQTWNSQYYRGEPIVVVAKEASEHAADAAVEKPLLLPVRSLKNGVSESSMIDFKVRSNSRNMRLSRVSPEESEEKPVLRSPIPWRSRSGRMEIKEDFTQSPSMPESNPIDSPSSRYQSVKPISDSSSENQSKSLQDVGRKKITHKSSFSPIPPPPPPPPPPPSQPRINSTTNTYSRKEFRRNATSFPDKFTEDMLNRERRGAEFTARTQSDTLSKAKSKSFRTRKENEFDEYLSHDKEIESFIERRGSQSKKFIEEDAQTFMEFPKDGKKEFMEIEKDAEESEHDDDDDDDEGDDELQELASKNYGEMVGSDNGPDVDKKADEFIAKFREQIRLQRIASIRSTTQTPKNGGR